MSLNQPEHEQKMQAKTSYTQPGIFSQLYLDHKLNLIILKFKEYFCIDPKCPIIGAHKVERGFKQLKSIKRHVKNYHQTTYGNL